MTRESDEKLDRALAAWAAARAINDERWDVLAQRVVAAQAAGADVIALSQPVAARPHPWRWVAALAAAACVCAALGIWRFGAWTNVERGGALASVPDPWSRPLEVQSQVLQEFQNVFDGNVAWLAAGPKRCDVGVKAAADSAAPAAEYVAVRLKLVRRASSDVPWEVVQVDELIIAQQIWAEVPSAALDGARLHVWAFPVDDGLVAVDLRYNTPALPSENVEVSTLQPRGEQMPVARFRHDGIEYLLEQVVEVLPPQKLG
jgi:hypothetical protein